MEVYDKLADPAAFAVFLLTLFLPVFIGFIALRRTKSQADFFVGGFRLMPGSLSRLNPALIDPFALSFGLIIGFLGIGLGSPGQPHIIVRYMSIDDPGKLRTSAIIGTFWNVVMGWGAVFIGLIGRVLFPAVRKLPGEDPETIYLVLSSKYFGPLIYGLLIGGIFAAILSTADSQLLVVASTFVRDFYEKIIKRGTEIAESFKLKLSRPSAMNVDPFPFLASKSLIHLLHPSVVSRLRLIKALFSNYGCAFGNPISNCDAWLDPE